MTLAIVYAGWLTGEDRTRTGQLIGGAGVVFAAAAGLMKTYYIVLGQGVFVCVLARHVLRGRGRKASWLAGGWPLLLFEACFCADWLLAGQKPADLPAFLRGSAELAGSTRLTNLPPAIAQGGFLLRQPPRTADDLARLLAGKPVQNPVRSIRLGGNGLLRASIGETVTYRFYGLDPPRPAAF